MKKELRLVTAATADLITVAEAKAHCRVMHSDEDAYFTALCAAVRDHLFGERGWMCIDAVEQTWELTMEDFPRGDDPVYLPRPPLKDVVGVWYTPTDGSAEVEITDFRTFGEATLSGGYILPAREDDWPDTDEEPESVRIRFTTGLVEVPPAIKHAALLLVGHWYENREAATEAKMNELPMAAGALLAPYRNYFS